MNSEEFDKYDAEAVKARFDIFSTSPDDAKPALMVTADGKPLLKPATVIVLYGAFGKGKTWAATLITTQFLMNDPLNAIVMWLALEGQHAKQGARFAQCGIEKAAHDGLYYRKAYTPGIAEAETDAGLWVVDSVSRLLEAVKPGASASDDAAVAIVETRLVDPLRDRADPPTVILLAHEAKNGGGLTPIGSQRWGSMADYVLRITMPKPWSRTTAGYSSLMVIKDRDGDYDQGAELARLVMVPGERPRFEVPSLAPEEGTPGGRVSAVAEFVKDNPGISRGDAVSQLAASKPHLGKRSSWYNSVAAAIAASLVREDQDGGLLPAD